MASNMAPIALALLSTPLAIHLVWTKICKLVNRILRFLSLDCDSKVLYLAHMVIFYPLKLSLVHNCNQET